MSKRRSPEIDVAARVVQLLEYRKYEVRCEIPSPWDNNKRLDVFGRRDDGTCIAVSCKTSARLQFFTDAAHWSAAAPTFLAFPQPDGVEWVPAAAAIAKELKVGTLALEMDTPDSFYEILPSRAEIPMSSRLQEAAMKHGTRWINRPGAAGGAPTGQAAYVADRLVDLVLTQGGPRSVTDYLKGNINALDTENPLSIVEDVAKIVNTQGRHAKVFARKMGSDWLVMRR